MPRHLAVVVGIGAAFFLVQLVLSLRVWLRARRQDRMLKRLLRDVERGGTGRRDVEDWPWNFPWLHWVTSVFPASGAASGGAAAGSAPMGSFSRDEALHELDTRIGSDASYLMLQRMGIMAPLLGVVLTVVGFYWLEIDQSGEESLQTILTSVTPLVSGVGAGAVLALINQVLLQVVGGRLEKLRMNARTWFDVAIWRFESRGDSGATTAAAAVERFGRAMAASAEIHAVQADRIGAATASLERAAMEFDAVVRALRGDVVDVPQALCDLRDAMAVSARALADLNDMGVRAVSNLDVSVAAFRTTIDREFTEAARLHYASSRRLADAVGQGGEELPDGDSNGHVRPR